MNINNNGIVDQIKHAIKVVVNSEILEISCIIEENYYIKPSYLQ
jgi:hypothetical protein